MAALDRIAGIVYMSGFLSLRDIAACAGCSLRMARITTQCLAGEPRVLNGLLATKPQITALLLAVSVTSGLALSDARGLRLFCPYGREAAAAPRRLRGLATLANIVPRTAPTLVQVLSRLSDDARRGSRRLYREVVAAAEAGREVSSTWPAWLTATGSVTDLAGSLIVAVSRIPDDDTRRMAIWEVGLVDCARTALSARATASEAVMLPSLPVLIGLCCNLRPDQGAAHPQPGARDHFPATDAVWELALASLCMLARLTACRHLVPRAQLIQLAQAASAAPISAAGMAWAACIQAREAGPDTPASDSCQSADADFHSSLPPFEAAAPSGTAQGMPVPELLLSCSLAVASAARCQSLQLASDGVVTPVTETAVCEAFAELCCVHAPLVVSHLTELHSWPVPAAWLRGIVRSMGAGAIVSDTCAQQYAAALAVTDGWAGVLLWVVSAVVARQDSILATESSAAALSAVVHGGRAQSSDKLTRLVLIQAAASKCLSLKDAALALARMARTGHAESTFDSGRRFFMGALSRTQSVLQMRAAESVATDTADAAATKLPERHLAWLEYDERSLDSLVQTGSTIQPHRVMGSPASASACIVAAARASSFSEVARNSQTGGGNAVEAASTTRSASPSSDSSICGSELAALGTPDSAPGTDASNSIDANHLAMKEVHRALCGLQECANALLASEQAPAPPSSVSAAPHPPPFPPPPSVRGSPMTPRMPSPSPAQQDYNLSTAYSSLLESPLAALNLSASHSPGRPTTAARLQTAQEPPNSAVGAARVAAACLHSIQPQTPVAQRVEAWSWSSPLRRRRAFAPSSHVTVPPLSPLSPLLATGPSTSPTKRRLPRSPSRPVRPFALAGSQPLMPSPPLPAAPSVSGPRGFAPRAEPLAPVHLAVSGSQDLAPRADPILLDNLPAASVTVATAEAPTAAVLAERRANTKRAASIARSLVAAGAGAFVHVCVVGQGPVAGVGCTSGFYPAPFDICPHDYERIGCCDSDGAAEGVRIAPGLSGDGTNDCFRHLATNWVYDVRRRLYMPPNAADASSGFTCRLVEVPSRFGSVLGAVYRAVQIFGNDS